MLRRNLRKSDSSTVGAFFTTVERSQAVKYARASVWRMHVWLVHWMGDGWMYMGDGGCELPGTNHPLTASSVVIVCMIVIGWGGGGWSSHLFSSSTLGSL